MDPPVDEGRVGYRRVEDVDSGPEANQSYIEAWRDSFYAEVSCFSSYE